MIPQESECTFYEAELKGIYAAILRAAQAGLTIPVWENGAVVRKHPDELEAEAAEGA